VKPAGGATSLLKIALIHRHCERFKSLVFRWGSKRYQVIYNNFPKPSRFENPTTEESFMLSKAQGKYFFCSEDKHLELVKAKTLIS
jgi:hypothetical protein